MRKLARRMIITSSNLATNLLLNLVGLDAARESMQRLEIDGVDICRAVEDERAFEQGHQQPDDSRRRDRAAARDRRRPWHVPRVGGRDVEHPARSAVERHDRARACRTVFAPIAKIAHKTGEISTVTHDAGAVFMPGRPPYLVAIFVESSGDQKERQEAGMAASTRDLGNASRLPARACRGDRAGQRPADGRRPRSCRTRTASSCARRADASAERRPAPAAAIFLRRRIERCRREYAPHAELRTVGVHGDRSVRGAAAAPLSALRPLRGHHARRGARSAARSRWRAGPRRGKRRLSFTRARRHRERRRRTAGALPQTSSASATSISTPRKRFSGMPPSLENTRRAVGHAPTARLGAADDHLHLDLGYVTVVPRDRSEAEGD